MEIPRLQWSGAEVHDGVLVVAIAGDRPKGFKATFERTVKLLDAGRWGDVKLKAGKVTVADVDEGGEESLRHFLESVMQEATAPLVMQDSGEDHDEDADDGPASDDADARMTERFRGFAAP